MALQILEGTWEEIRAHERELAGQQVRLEIIPNGRTVSRSADPPVVFSPSSKPILTDEIRDVLNPFVDLLLADIRQYAIPASKIEIVGVEYPDDGSEKISVRLLMNCDTDEETWRYFTDFLTRAEGWIKGLKPDQHSIFRHKISFRTGRLRNA
jgi:hypothetical protein